MSDIKKIPESSQFDPSANLPDNAPGNLAYPIAKVQAHAIQPIDKQASDTHQTLRSMAHVLAKRCLKYSLSVSKTDATKLHALAQTMGIAYDRAYHGASDTGRGPQHVLIQLFGASGAGQQIARNLTAMVPQVDVVDATVVEDKH